jgi:hypothetical protein
MEHSSKRSGTVNSCNAERLGTLKPERSNALKRIVEKFNSTFTFQNLTTILA